MTVTGYPHLLVASHISAAFGPPKRVQVPTSRRATRPIQHKVETLENHAIYASICADDRVGNILLRVINGGYHLELTLLDSDDEPTRFEFSERILPMPAVVPSHLNQRSAEVLALTYDGTLYRLVYPLEGRQYHEVPTKEWCAQHSIYSSVPRPLHGIALVHNEQRVVIALENGVLLQMDAHGATQQDAWEERLHYIQQGPQSGVLSKILRPGHSEADQIISIASLPSNPGCDIIFTVSRDRTLRAWDRWAGNVSWASMPPLPGLDGDGQRDSVLPQTTPAPFGLLSPDPRTLLRVIMGESRVNHNPLDVLRVLAFIPTPFSNVHAGFFILYSFDTRTNKLVVVGEKLCSSRTLGCELRDFQVSQSVLHVVWDTGGRALYEITQLDIGDWVANSDDEEQSPDLWHEAQYLDDEVLSPTFTDMFNFSNDPQAIKEEIINAILRPGAFSPYTVQTALEGYCKSLLTMPDPPYKALQEPYEGIVERISGIVGCTVTKVIDPATGAELWENYWTALKRDIEGFLARCRDIERSARWPLALARYEDQIVLLERERTGILVNQDVPLSLYRQISFQLEEGITEDGPYPPSQYPILHAAMFLRYRIHVASWKDVEDSLRFFPKSEPEQTYNTTLLEMAQELDVAGLDESTAQAVLLFLNPLEQHADQREAFTKVINLLRDVGADVKDEEDEDEGYLLDIVPKGSEQRPIDHHHQWSKSVTASYLTSTLEARYALVSSVLFLLIFLAWRENNDYNDYVASQIDPDIIDAFFALHRSITILKYIGAQVTEGPEGKQLKSGALTPKNSLKREGTADTLLERLEGLDMGRRSVSWLPDQYNFKVKSIQSLLQAVLDPLPDKFSLPYASDYFLRSTHLLASDTALISGEEEVILLKRLSGYPAVVLQVADWLPKMGGVCYVVGRMGLQLGDVDGAADYFERVARNFGPLAKPTDVEITSLRAVVALDLSSLTAYYAHIAELFRDAGNVPYDVHFSRFAIQHAEPHESTGDLWKYVFEGQLAQKEFEPAYLTLVTMPDRTMRRECVSKLVEVMCVENWVEMLMKFNFVGFSGEVEQVLRFKSRNAIPDRKPLYAQVLYGWYIQRGDYRNAAYTMYYRARKLDDHLFTGMRDASQTDQLLALQMDAYTVAIGALSMLDSKDAWISVHVASVSREGISAKQVLDIFPLEMLKEGLPNVEIVNLVDMRKEFILCKSRRQLARWEFQDDWKMGHLEVISRYAQAGLFEEACVAASAFQEDMTGIFVLLVDQCVRFSVGDHSSLPEHETGWLQAEHIARWEGSDDYKGWRLLLDLLDRHDNLQNGYRYRKTCFERLLALNQVVPPPARLIQFFQEREPEYLIRTYLRYDMVSTALDSTLTLVDEFNARAFDMKQSPLLTNGKLTSNVSAPDAKTQQQTYLRLPYTLIDAATEAATEEADRAKATKIKRAVEERVQKLSAKKRP